MDSPPSDSLLQLCANYLIGPYCSYEYDLPQAYSLLSCVASVPPHFVQPEHLTIDLAQDLVIGFFEENYDYVHPAYREHLATWPL